MPEGFNILTIFVDPEGEIRFVEFENVPEQVCAAFYQIDCCYINRSVSEVNYVDERIKYLLLNKEWELRYAETKGALVNKCHHLIVRTGFRRNDG